MPFTKTTAKILGSKGGKQQVKNKHDLWDLLASGHKDDYNDKLEVLRDGKSITKPETEFMNRVERLFPYTKARKTDITTDGKELQPVLVKFLNDDKHTK